MRFMTFVLSVAVASATLMASSVSWAQTSQPDFQQELPLDGDALTEIFQGTLHRGYYEFENWDNQDPAFSEEMGEDGSAIHIRNGVRSTGEWRTQANVVCFTYENLNGGCFNIYQRGTCYYAVSAQYGDLVAITFLDGTQPDCEPAYA